MEVVLIVVVIAVAVIIGVVVHQKNTDPHDRLLREQQKRWRQLQPDIRNIEDIHSRATGQGKKVGVFEKKKVKESLANSKQQYIEYIDFCKRNELDLPSNNEQMESQIIETEDKLDPNGALDRELERSQKKYDEVYDIVNKAGESLFNTRQAAAKQLDTVENLINSIAKSPKKIEKSVTTISVHKDTFKKTVEYAEEQKKTLENAAKGGGTGVLAAAGIAGVAPSAAMWVATTFGTASTGTAISALSGAAASNAALAWLGGGAAAAGGGGVAAGQALLALAGPIGWGVAGGTVLTVALAMVAKNFKVKSSKKKEIAKMKECTEALMEVKGQIDFLSLQTKSLYDNLKNQINECEAYRGSTYADLDENQQNLLWNLANNTATLSELLNKTVD